MRSGSRDDDITCLKRHTGTARRFFDRNPRKSICIGLETDSRNLKITEVLTPLIR